MSEPWPFRCYHCNQFISSFDIDDSKAMNVYHVVEKRGGVYTEDFSAFDVWFCPDCIDYGNKLKKDLEG